MPPGLGVKTFNVFLRLPFNISNLKNVLWLNIFKKLRSFYNVNYNIYYICEKRNVAGLQYSYVIWWWLSDLLLCVYMVPYFFPNSVSPDILGSDEIMFFFHKLILWLHCGFNFWEADRYNYVKLLIPNNKGRKSTLTPNGLPLNWNTVYQIIMDPF